MRLNELVGSYLSQMDPLEVSALDVCDMLSMLYYVPYNWRNDLVSKFRDQDKTHKKFVIEGLQREFETRLQMTTVL